MRKKNSKIVDETPPLFEAPPKPKRPAKARAKAEPASDASAEDPKPESGKKDEMATARAKKAPARESAASRSKVAAEEPIAVELPQKQAKPAALKTLSELVEEEKKLPPAERKKRREESKAAASKVVAAAPARKSPVKAKKSAKEPVPDIEAVAIDETQDFGEGIIVIWRSKPGPEKPASPPSSAPVAARKSKSGKKGDSQQVEDTDLANGDLKVTFRKGEGSTNRRGRSKSSQEPLPVPEPPPPAIPRRPAIPIPPEAPQVVLRGTLPTIVCDGQVIPPIGFFGSAPDERRAQTVLEEIRRAADAGIHLHSILVDFEVDKNAAKSAVEFAAYMLSEVVKADPKAKLLFRIVFGAPRDWDAKYKSAVYTTHSGKLAEPSVCDDEFWGEARDLLSDFIRQIRSLPNASSVIGVHLDRGEWFMPEGTGYDNSPAATNAFREWLKTRYVNDLVAFRAAWFDGAVSFSTVSIPEFTPSAEGEMFIRLNRRERRWVDYHLFLSDATFGRISDLAYAAKAASEGWFLVGVNYGYTFEWSHPASGHLSLGKLLRTREVDFIAGPPSYRTREPGGAAPFPCPVDSLTLNGKLYISEEDFKTAIRDYREPDDYNPVIKTPQALEAIHWRGTGSALAHGAGVMWMDLWGNGWLNTQTTWERASKASECLVTRMAAPLAAPEVAIFIDERALAYLVDQKSFALLVQNVRESVMRSGLSAGFYLLSDLAHRENFPECKLYVFVNAWDIRPEHRQAIKNRLQRDGKTLFWLYCAGMFDNGREALERAREITGIAIKPQPFHSRSGTTVLRRRHPLAEAFGEEGLIGGAHIDPSYFAIPENAIVLGEYSQSGLPSFVMRSFDEDPDPSKHWKSVFLGEPYVTPGLLRALGQVAGCHIWNYHEDVVHVRQPFLSIHTTGSGQRSVALPHNWEAYNLLTKEWETEDKNHIRFQAMDGATYQFLVGDRHEIEAILQSDPADLLRVDELPQRPTEEPGAHDTLFDVPIMRLDAFFEGSPDEVGDEWFLMPGRIDPEVAGGPEPARNDDEKVGRRRRRRGGQSSSGTASTFDEDLGMNVMFRKRE